MRSVVLMLALVLAGCSKEPVADVDRVEALELLNSGQVVGIGVSHDGWVVMSLEDGSFRTNKAEVLGYPRELLAECGDCSEVSVWLE